MATQTATIRNVLAAAYNTAAVSVALYSTAPGGTAGTEITGGSYARKVPTWSTPVNGVTNATLTFDIPAGATVAGWGAYNASATYLDGATLTSQAFATAGQYTVTVSFTAS